MLAMATKHFLLLLLNILSPVLCGTSQNSKSSETNVGVESLERFSVNSVDKDHSFDEHVPPKNKSYFNNFQERLIVLAELPPDATPPPEKIVEQGYGGSNVKSWWDKTQNPTIYQPSKRDLKNQAYSSSGGIIKNPLLNSRDKRQLSPGFTVSITTAHPLEQSHNQHQPSYSNNANHKSSQGLREPYYAPPAKAGSFYEAPKYKNPTPATHTDEACIITQSNIYTENVRDYANSSKIFQNYISPEDVMRDFGKTYVKASLNDATTTSNAANSNALDSFAVVYLESRLKMTNDSVQYGILSTKPVLRGKLIYPDSNDIEYLHPVKFSFSGPTANDWDLVTEKSTYAGASMKNGIKSLLKLTSNLHTRAFRELRKTSEKMLRRSKLLTRPKLPVPHPGSDEDPLAGEEANARSVQWLHTITMAIRSVAGGVGTPQAQRFGGYSK